MIANEKCSVVNITNNSKDSFYRINFFRGIASLFVLTIHCQFPAPIGTYIVALGRFAVPFFIMISGFFSYYDDLQTAQIKANLQLKKTIQLFAKIVLIYSISNSIVSYINHGRFNHWLYNLTSFETIFRFLFLNRAVFLCSVAYYPLMMIYVYSIYIQIIKRKLLNQSYQFIVGLLIVNIVINEFWGLNWFYSGNWLLTGIPFFLLGNWIHASLVKLKVKFYDQWKCIFIVAGGGILSLGERILIGSYYCSIGTVITVLGLFMFCLLGSYTNIQKTTVGNFIRDCSSIIFLIHIAVKDLLTAFGLISQGASWRGVFWVTLISILIAIGYSVYMIKRGKNR